MSEIRESRCIGGTRSTAARLTDLGRSNVFRALDHELELLQYGLGDGARCVEHEQRRQQQRQREDLRVERLRLIQRAQALGVDEDKRAAIASNWSAP